MNDVGVGWRANTFRIVVFISDNQPWTSYNISTDIGVNNVVPLFYMTTPTQIVYDTYKAYADLLPISFLNFSTRGSV